MYLAPEILSGILPAVLLVKLDESLAFVFYELFWEELQEIIFIIMIA